MRCGSAQATAERGFEDGKILDGERTIENHIYLAPEKERGGGGHATFYEGGPAGDEGQIPRG